VNDIITATFGGIVVILMLIAVGCGACAIMTAGKHDDEEDERGKSA